MRIVYFTHSLKSCWNHGNAHFLRGVLRELMHRGHDVVVWEPESAWSLVNMLADHGPGALKPFEDAYPELTSRTYAPTSRLDIEAACDGADLVIVHEWNAPEVVEAAGAARRRGNFTLFFHDTHHRAVSDTAAMRAFDLDEYDGVLAFGEALAEVYRGWGWGDRVFVWHEAADVAVFRPPASPTERSGLLWIGNWGDGERTQEIEDFLLAPARDAGLALDVHGVRYPDKARRIVAYYGACYLGWLANAAAPETFARYIATVHVPRRFYVAALPGIPTIRVFEALACGIPLVCAPWRDAERLFRPGEDYLTANSGEAMTAHLKALKGNPDLRASLAANGRETILARHTCGHRADELIAIASRYRAAAPVLEAVS